MALLAVKNVTLNAVWTFINHHHAGFVRRLLALLGQCIVRGRIKGTTLGHIWHICCERREYIAESGVYIWQFTNAAQEFLQWNGRFSLVLIKRATADSNAVSG